MNKITKPETFIFIGRSGCGKGTQAELLKKYIEENDTSGRKIFYMEIGERFREFIKGNSFASGLSEEINKKGELQPEFLAVWIWANEFVNGLKGNEHLIIDGTPRKPREAKVFDSAMRFFNRENPNVIFVNVSREWAFDKLLKRGREDDEKTGEINKRLDWYENDVAPTVEFFKNSSDYKFHDINGEQSIENVHNEIIKKVFK